MSPKLMNRKQVKIGKTKFYILPFPALTASRLSGEVSSIIGPVLAGFVPMLNGAVDKNGKKKDLLDMDLVEVAGPLGNALGSIDGEKIEKLVRDMLLVHDNISYEMKDEDGNLVQDILDEDALNEIFCMDVSGMYQLTWEVMKLNFGTFFKKALDLFGDAEEETLTMTK